jgi:hypothetical protein
MLRVSLGEAHHQWKRDMHPNGEIIKRGYDAFGRGDMPTVFGMRKSDGMSRVKARSPEIVASGKPSALVGQSGLIGIKIRCGS